MNAVEILEAAREAGLKLALNGDKDAVMAGPPHKITARIRSSIRRNKDELMRHLLFREAAAYLQKKITDRGMIMDEAAATAACNVFSQDLGAFDDAWRTKDIDAFKAFLRERVRDAGRTLAEHQRVAPPPRSSGESPDHPNLQQTLPEAS
ncbi:hypothetical protein GBA63_22595 (plasmid) [Rubrobacter tropicus]|uniref:Uncharacterized protein n=1 Tax=Rubrobacter tropicus TaxID=2653851 RepID=A0A6G8QGF1_9ACTN|nr:hypothetical protein [Rubrobacter tropicus]QIN85491.1 hypothetical protein GBA63_22595 [Rubrobacter tropicus]